MLRPVMHIAALHVYPVKSCRGLALTEAVLDERGIVHDREFMVVDEANRLRTQRADPKLAHVETTLGEDALTLDYPGAAALRVPFRDSSRRQREVTVWSDTVQADDTGDGAAAWFSGILGKPSRLVVMGARSRRVRHEIGTPDRTPVRVAQPIQLSFPDGFPLHLISEQSLVELNRCLDLPEPLEMERFRPNIVVAGCEAPYAEDGWTAIWTGGVRLLAAGPCGRCAIPTTDQQSLARTAEPLRYLARYRRMPDGEAVFGQYFVHSSTGGRLRLGDAVVPEG